jgi:hypothetical protein
MQTKIALPLMFSCGMALVLLRERRARGATTGLFVPTLVKLNLKETYNEE